MNDEKAQEKSSPWLKTSYSNLIRYKPSGKYFARLRVHGKLIVRSLKTTKITVAKLRLPEGIMGDELAEQLLAKNPRLKVIFTSGYSPGMAGKDVSLIEGRNFLPKPYSIEKLAQFVRECLDAPLKQN